MRTAPLAMIKTAPFFIFYENRFGRIIDIFERAKNVQNFKNSRIYFVCLVR